MNNLTFEYPYILYLTLLLIPMWLWYYYKDNNAQLQVSNLKAFSKPPKTFRYYLRHAPLVLRSAVIILIIMALARPQSFENDEEIATEGIDIVLTLDISSSMLAVDFEPNRLEASKNVAQEFISSRPYDRIGLVVFSSESFTQCPITSDHATLMNMFADIQQGIIEDGTAIGLGLATAVNRLKDSKAKSRIIILLTDGVNNQGDIAPLTAAKLASKFGIRVYTIGIGKNGTAPYPVRNLFGGISYTNMEVRIDEETLRKIASQTDGKYYRAINNKKLKEIYTEIDKLEKSKIQVTKYSKKNEEFFYFVVIAGLLLLTEMVIKITILRNIP